MDALLAEAIHLQRQGRTAQAEHLYQALVAAEPTSPIFLNGYGILCAQMGNYPRAEALFREAMRQAPDFMDAQMNLGNLLLASGDFQEGITLLGSVAALRPDRADGLYNFGRALAALLEIAPRPSPSFVKHFWRSQATSRLVSNLPTTCGVRKITPTPRANTVPP